MAEDLKEGGTSRTEQSALMAGWVCRQGGAVGTAEMGDERRRQNGMCGCRLEDNFLRGKFGDVQPAIPSSAHSNDCL